MWGICVGYNILRIIFFTASLSARMCGVNVRGICVGLIFFTAMPRPSLSARMCVCVYVWCECAGYMRGLSV